MAQNEDELRPTGGFLTGGGVITIENGRILDLALKDSNGVDNWRDKPYDLPPQPLVDFMLSEMFLFRDANFWANFPQSAQTAMDLYAYGQDESALNGAVAIDQEFMRLLIDATGPIAIDESREINAQNLIRTLQRARDPEEGQAIGDWVGDRKAFLSGFAGAIRTKLESDFTSVDPVKLARNMLAALDQRHVQVYMLDGGTAQALTDAGWDGRLPEAPPGDFWMVVDTNVGFNKANLFINRAFDYTVDLRTPDAPSARLTTTYAHGGEPTDTPCYQGVEQEFEAGTGYLTLANKCYWNYVRVFAPTGSQLTDSSRHVVPAETLFSGTQWDSIALPIQDTTWLATFANFMLLPQGESAEFFVAYDLPQAILTSLPDDTTLYELHIQKQAGTRPEPLQVQVQLPDGAEILEVFPAEAIPAGSAVQLDMVMDGDTVIRIRYR